MKPVQQTIFSKNLGDCFRACVCSILEIDICDMPNFWEQTQDGDIFWNRVNDWLFPRGYKCILVNVAEDHRLYSPVKSTENRSISQ